MERLTPREAVKIARVGDLLLINGSRIIIGRSIDMPYNAIRPPFTLKLREMPRAELRRYFQWFMEVLPHRIIELHSAVTGTSGFGNWKADCSPDSLNDLGDWFVIQVETRPRTQEEIDSTLNQKGPVLAVPTIELTDRTFSLAMDIGMYMSQVLLKNYHSLEWMQPLGSRKFIDYGQPSLKGFGVVSLNPVRIVVVLAYGLADKSVPGKRLREIYDRWTQRIQ